MEAAVANPLILPAPGYDWDHNDEARRNFAVKRAMDSKLERPDVETVMTDLFKKTSNFADDAAAALGGVPIGGLYRTGSFIKIRVG